MVPNISDVDIRLLRLFVAVVDAGGFAAAQNELNLSLPTISGQMSRLETRLGVRLCERGRRGFRLTSEGRRVYELSRGLLCSLEDFHSEIGILHERLMGRLNIGAVDNIANNADCPLHAAIAAFDMRPNSVEISVDIAAPVELERAVAEGRLHLGIGPKLFDLPGLDYRHIFGERQHLYCGANHPLFARAPNAMADGEIAKARYVAHSCPIPDFYAGGDKLAPYSVGQHMESVAVLILSGRYIGFLPDHYAHEWVKKDKMRAIRPQTYAYDNAFHIITRKHERPTRVLSAFLHDLLCAKEEPRKAVAV